ncbi:hypothetical protein HJG60_008619 [Phyllostomus discolor]|uniref:Uncharacterized protein n=1 Tax=Phyllostomus discolor TaxID=89673 RepID=A0A833YT03_9CHIR|nr:hypothetical protein HJG60_008619 [Phyllostomus discolor]
MGARSSGKKWGGELGRRMEGSARGARDEFSREQSLIWRCWSVYRWLIPVYPQGFGPSAPLHAHRESKMVTRRRQSRSAPEPSPFPPSPLLAAPKSDRPVALAPTQIRPRWRPRRGFPFYFFALVISNDITSCIPKHSRVGGSKTTAQVPPTQTPRAPRESLGVKEPLRTPPGSTLLLPAADEGGRWGQEAYFR